jgi:multidrug efflux pump
MSRLNLSEWALKHRSITLFAMIVLAGAGVWAYLGLGRAEDPGFTLKTMVVVADWPGASAETMSREVADPIERKLEELPFLDYTASDTRAGHTVVTITLKDSTPAGHVPDLWYQVRKKLGDLRPMLPDGVQGPFFNDEFGDVYGLVYAVEGDGFTLPELRHVAEDVRERLLTVPGIGKIQLLGQQDERIYVEFSYQRLAQLGLTANDLFAAIRQENGVAASGFVDTSADRVTLRIREAAAGVDALRKLPVQAQGHLIPLGEIATVHRGTVDPPASVLRHDGHPALALAISMADGGNILDLGKQVAARLREIEPQLPLGVHLARINDQSQVVAKDVGEFQDSFLEALGIVLLVSFLSLGWRTGIVVAISVPLVLAGVLVAMRLLGIDLQRISLGAMIIALGLLVDDAIIAVETMSVKLEQGWERLRAGSFAWSSTAFPMLTGTLVTAAGYLPVGLARSSTGEYTQDIFRVVGLALVFSWVVAVLFVPYLGAKLLPEPRHRVADPHAVYDTGVYRRFRRVVTWCVRWRWVVIVATVLAFAASVVGFLRVPQQFFPSSDRREVMVDLRLPEGGSFAATDAAARRLDAILQSDAGVTSWATYVGTGTPRFFLAFSPELSQPNFAQFVVNTGSVKAREALLRKLWGIADSGAAGGFADVRLRASRLELGPPVGYPVQFRVTGPDPLALRRIAGEVRDALRADPHLRNAGLNWGTLGKRVEVSLDQDKARLLGLTSADLANALQTLEQGAPITAYREGTDLIPVVARAAAPEKGGERGDLAGLADVPVAARDGHVATLGQVATLRSDLEWPAIERRNRTPVLIARADIADATQAPVATANVMPAVDRIRATLPPGYRIETAGAVEESAKGQASVNAVMPFMVLVMLALLMVQLQSFRLVLMVVLTAPLGLIGVTAALLITGAPFGFVAMLGFIALAGIIMRNSVILVDQIEQDISAGLTPSEAIVEATVRRARPILLTAAAAVFALVPLAYSVFWGPMAIAIMGGLIAATVLTLCVVPALYAAWGGVRVPAEATPAMAAE